MNKTMLRLLLFSLCGTLLAGCAGMRAMQPAETFSPPSFTAGKYAPKVANFQFIVDTSSSMGEHGKVKLQTARNLVAAINQGLPEDLGYNGGLRTFGDHFWQLVQPTDLVYGMTKYTRSGLQKGLDKVRNTGGVSPLPEAIAAAGRDLKGATGKSALVIVSDGQVESEMGGAPAAAAKLKAAMGDNLCIYTVAVGGNAAGEKFLQKVAQAGGCGFSTNAAALAAPAALGSFVENVFLTAKGASAPKPMPPKDSDGDGVIDSRDKCPNTPKGQLVDADGCPLKLTLHINFDFDKADIKPEFEPDLQKAADFIQKNKDVPYILIEGYTDSMGDDVYNMKLSQRRAVAVKQALVDKYGIDAKRLVAKGGGESNPVADNGTEAGRAQNRRVEIVCCVILPPQ